MLSPRPSPDVGRREPRRPADWAGPARRRGLRSGVRRRPARQRRAARPSLWPAGWCPRLSRGWRSGRAIGTSCAPRARNLRKRLRRRGADGASAPPRTKSPELAGWHPYVRDAALVGDGPGTGVPALRAHGDDRQPARGHRHDSDAEAGAAAGVRQNRSSTPRPPRCGGPQRRRRPGPPRRGGARRCPGRRLDLGRLRLSRTAACVPGM